jgi:hypothetical protein
MARFPELVARIREPEEWGREGSPSDLWDVLWEAFAEAHLSPRNDGLIQRVYEYCRWCLEQPADQELVDSVVLGFFERIPTVPAAVEDMPRWWTRTEILGSKEVLSYRVGEEGFSRILAQFDRSPDGGPGGLVL